MWQVAYERSGMQYWWDYDANVRHGLEHSWKFGELLGFHWDWAQRKEGQISEYVADRLCGFVVNQSSEYWRQIRRMLLPACAA